MTEQLTSQEKSKSETALRQDMMLESQICGQTETLSPKPIYLNMKKIGKTNVDVAKTLCARDYKGFGTGFDTMNGVIEWNEK